ncbi:MULTISPECIES: transcriptional regulator HexR [Chromobacterium]|uniref:transcriptional regulator HexR n=1 Tax=Chromobacterium TaxID=535 RepID=UPI0006532BCD|nr:MULTISPECIES: transcriptional regulator HexR [Chromobacterium]KMN78939.1 transcriptional regulator [Chromobacterium sp. LK11]MBN3006021.1 transcriptional regulator HexR [Chromobacterium alkanivorans]MCP1292110.1 transcriptional regulator HexR [Chromobacterium sp. S0633]MCS3805647.1 RpiR family carbohydrate utilization transcriptional regulator [Chromobacterium alkanivorans]MCS3820123.1 RpiR family carbohydrate utilization transcriptional regulator [Chromobacterium alkanivorans]
MLERIRSQLEILSSAERKVAELVLEQPYTVIQAAVADIAKNAGVSQPTVIRFCRTVGCSGLPDFKLKLAGSLVTGVPYVHSSVRPEDPTSEIVAKVFDNTVSALLKCRNDVNPQSIESAVRLLTDARRIEFYGLGNSGIIAADAQHKFFRFGIPTVAYSDTHIQMMAASVLGPGDVLVAISSSGRTLELLEAVDVALSAGASVVALTTSGSPLARRSTVALIADTLEDNETYSPMISRIVHLVQIDILAVSVALKRGPGLISQLEKTKHSLKNRRLDNKTEED